MTSIPALAVTADITVREQCAAAGMDDMITRPVDQRRLRAAPPQPIPQPGEDADTSPARSMLDRELVFDPKRYDEIFGDGAVGGREWLDGYVEGASRMVDAIREAITADARGPLQASAHRLAGSSLTVGAARLGTLARSLERAVIQASRGQLHDLGQEIVAVFDATCRQIRQFINSGTSVIS